MSGVTMRVVRAVRRRVTRPIRRGVMRLLRPVFARIETHMQWLFDRQQEDRAQLQRLEQQVRVLQAQLSASQRENSRRSYAA